MARLARHCGRTTRQRRQAEGVRGRGQERRILRHSAARHGRIEPLSGSARADLRQTPGFPRLHMLDSTDPAQIRSVENKIDLAKTLFIVSSKSGSTLEPNIYKQYFFERVQQTVGATRRAATSSRSPTPARRCSRSPSATTSATFSSACPPSADATRRSRTSAWFPPRRWASTPASSSSARKKWSKPARRPLPWNKIRA